MMVRLSNFVMITLVCLAATPLVQSGEPDSYLGPKPVRHGAETLLPHDFRTARAAGANYSGTLLTAYLTNAQLGTWTSDFVTRCSSIARRFSIGKSTSGVDLWVVEIAAKPGVVEAKPNFRYVSRSTFRLQHRASLRCICFTQSPAFPVCHSIFVSLTAAGAAL
jgi:hypothetical protein